MTYGGRRPLVEDEIWWKTTFDGRQPLLEDNLQFKMTCGGRQPLVEDDLWWKTEWKTPFSGRRPLLDPCMLAAYSTLRHFLIRSVIFHKHIGPEMLPSVRTHSAGHQIQSKHDMICLYLD